MPRLAPLDSAEFTPEQKRVADAMGVTDAGIFGDILCARMAKKNVAGLVTDGVVRDLAGVATEAVVEVRSGSGKRLASMVGAVLCTHFGLSGPAAMDAPAPVPAQPAEDGAAPDRAAGGRPNLRIVDAGSPA